MKDVEAVDFITFGYGKIKTDKGKDIGFGNSQGRVETGYEVGHLGERYELGGVGIVPAKKEQTLK